MRATLLLQVLLLVDALYISTEVVSTPKNVTSMQSSYSTLVRIVLTEV